MVLDRLRYGFSLFWKESVEMKIYSFYCIDQLNDLQRLVIMLTDELEFSKGQAKAILLKDPRVFMMGKFFFLKLIVVAWQCS